MLDVIKNHPSKIIKNSTAKGFLAECNDGNLWFVRCKKIDKNSKRLFSTYLSHILGLEFKLSVPEVSIVKLDKTFIERLNKNSIVFDIDCCMGVATKFIPNLVKMRKPKSKSNYEYLKSKLSFINLKQIYGIKIFAHWIFLSDYYKSENIQISKNNNIYFLDFDMAFLSNYGDWGPLPEYEYRRCVNNPAPFMEGFSGDIVPMEEWFDNMQKINYISVIEKTLTIPKCWEVPEGYLYETLSHLFFYRSIFIKEFKRAIEYNINRNNYNIINPF